MKPIGTSAKTVNCLEISMQPSTAEPRQFAFIPWIKSYFALIALMAGIVAFPQMAYGRPYPTTTTLTISSTSVNAGKAATLTATVVQNADQVTRGMVVFCRMRTPRTARAQPFSAERS